MKIENYSTSSGPCLPETPKKSKKKNNNFPLKQLRDWAAREIPFTQDPNLIWYANNISCKVKCVWHFIIMHNPSFPSMNLITKSLAISKTDALNAIKELQFRKIINVTQTGKGRKANTYIVNMEISQWILDGPKFKKRHKNSPVAVPTSTHKETSGTNLNPLQSSSGTNLNPLEAVAVPTSTRIYINPHTNGEINIRENESAPLNGPFNSPKNINEEKKPTLTFRLCKGENT